MSQMPDTNPAYPLREPDGWRPWNNRVPDWVRRGDAVNAPPRGRKLAAATARAIVQGAADVGEADDAGNIVHIIGGLTLARACGVAMPTLNRYITYLVDAGVLVVMSRGGVLGLGQRAKKVSIANTYGIPAQPGSLDHRRVPRRRQAMRPDGLLQNGAVRYVPDVTTPGATATLWPKPEQPSPQQAGYPAAGQIVPASPVPRAGAPPGRERDTTPVSPGHYPRVPGTRPPSSGTIRGINGKNHGRGACAADEKKRSAAGEQPSLPRCPHVQPRDLADVGRLLALFEACVERGVVERSDRLHFAATAACALRVCREARTAGRTDKKWDPCLLFPYRINRRLWLLYGSRDEDVAQRWLADHDRARDRRPPASASAATAARLSDDAVLARVARDLALRNSTSPWPLLERKGWTRERYEAALRELKEAGCT